MLVSSKNSVSISTMNITKMNIDDEHTVQRLVCSRCCSSHLYAAIVHCCNTVTPGGLYLCNPCHITLHPGCRKKKAHSILMDDYCSWCNTPTASLVCPLCVMHQEESIPAKLCQSCNDQVHTDHKEMHKDHVFSIASH